MCLAVWGRKVNQITAWADILDEAENSDSHWRRVLSLLGRVGRHAFESIFVPRGATAMRCK